MYGILTKPRVPPTTYLVCVVFQCVTATIDEKASASVSRECAIVGSGVMIVPTHLWAKQAADIEREAVWRRAVFADMIELLVKGADGSFAAVRIDHEAGDQMRHENAGKRYEMECDASAVVRCDILQKSIIVVQQPPNRCSIQYTHLQNVAMEVRPVTVLAVRMIAHADHCPIVNGLVTFDVQSSAKFSELLMMGLMRILCHTCTHYNIRIHTAQE